MFRLSLVLDWIFGLILLIRPNSELILKIRPNACGHLKKLYKLGLRPKFGLRTKSDLFYQVTQRVTSLKQLVRSLQKVQGHKAGVDLKIVKVTQGLVEASFATPLG